MTKYTYPTIPEFVVDQVGNEVRPGDYIVYAVRSGNSAYMYNGIVVGFQYPKDIHYSYNQSVLKIRIKNTLTEKISLILESNACYAKVVLPAEPVLDLDQ